MAATLQEISEALVARLSATVPGLAAAPRYGPVRELPAGGLTPPLAAVALERAAYRPLSSDSRQVLEELTFRLTLVAEDFRGRGCGLAGGYGLLEAVRAALQGQTLGLEGLAPLELSAAVLDLKSEEAGLTVYTLKAVTWQVRLAA